MRIYYHLSQYISHRLTGMDYVSCLRQSGHIVNLPEDSPAGADLAILHDDPLRYEFLFSAHPELHAMPTVALCVWENETLARAYLPPLSLVRQIWTPSHFSCRSLRRHFSDVHVLPHLVKRIAPSPEDLAQARELLGAEEQAFYFFSVVDSVNPRKNVRALLGAFSAVRDLLHRDVRLALKQYRVDFDYSGLPGVVGINGCLTPGCMAALYALTDAYVSAHHAEGWGLGLSDAMAYGKPVIATAYSGNMDFMDVHNSLPVPYRLAPVSQQMCERIPLFSPDMRWAEIDQEALVLTMKRVAEGRISPELQKRAAAITTRFGRERIRARLDELLSPFA